jgi:hypothetical protein
VILLYAVTPSGGDRSATAAAGLKAYDDGRVAVLHREQEVSARPETEQLLSFGAVVRRLAAAGPVLPLRYGTVVADEAELARLVDEHAGEWSELLRSLAGHSELIVHLPAAAAPEPATGSVSGRDYLLARAAAVHDRDARREQLAALPGVRAVRELPSRGPGSGEHRISLLVADSQVADVGRQVTAWAGDRGTTARVTGPWPPFSFCTPDAT